MSCKQDFHKIDFSHNFKSNAAKNVTNKTWTFNMTLTKKKKKLAILEKSQKSLVRAFVHKYLIKMLTDQTHIYFKCL